MNQFIRKLAPCLLATVLVPAQTQDPAVRIGFNPLDHTITVQAFHEGEVFLAVGAMATPPIWIGGIELNVAPRYVLELGAFTMGQTMVLPVTRDLRDLYAEAVLVDAKWRFFDSHVGAFMDAYVDLVDATFYAALSSTDSIPPYYALHTSLTAPTSGYALTLDTYATQDKVTYVYLRLVEPGVNEITLPVLTPHKLGVALGTNVGLSVEVHLVRVQRGTIGPDVYRLMARLPVF